MTCKIERVVSGENLVVIRVCGRIQVEHVSVVKDLIRREQGVVVLDLSEVTLVDREAVNLIAMCALKNLELRNCPAFLREWVTKERQSVSFFVFPFSFEFPGLAFGTVLYGKTLATTKLLLGNSAFKRAQTFVATIAQASSR